MRFISQTALSRFTLVLLALKLYFYWRGNIFLDLPANLILLALVYLPIARPWLQIIRAILVVVAALGLASYELFPVPWMQAFAFYARQEGPTLAFTLNFMKGFFHPLDLAYLVALIGVAFMPTRGLLIGWGVGVFFLCLMGVPSNNEGLALKARVDDFYQKQAPLLTAFPHQASSNFDIVIIHVCSLGWDDLDYLKVDGEDFFAHFDMVMTRFNSVTSYSEDAAVRLLISAGGQRRYAVIPEEVPAGAYLLEHLRALNYKTWAGYDLYDPSYIKILRDEGKADFPVSDDGLAHEDLFYDDHPLYDSGALLAKLTDLRQASGASRALLWFNFAALHSGVHMAKDIDWWDRQDSEQVQWDQGKENVLRFFAAIGGYLDGLEKKAKPTLVVFIAEHGRGIRGSDLQPPELREIPTPQLTYIPVALRWIDGAKRPPAHLVFSTGTSYRAVSQLIAASLTKWPSDPAKLIPEVSPVDYYTEVYSERMVTESKGAYTLLNLAELPVAGTRYLTSPVKYQRTRLQLRLEAGDFKASSPKTLPPPPEHEYPRVNDASPTPR